MVLERVFCVISFGSHRDPAPPGLQHIREVPSFWLFASVSGYTATHGVACKHAEPMPVPRLAALSRLPDNRGLWWREWTQDAVEAILNTLNNPHFAYVFERSCFGVKLARRQVPVKSFIDSICLHVSGAHGARDGAGSSSAEPLDAYCSLVE